MTSNQLRAVELAREIVDAELLSIELAEEEWALLLMAADLCNPLARPKLVAQRVLDHSNQQFGYFATPKIQSKAPGIHHDDA